MLTKNHIESELSIAYVQAVAAKAGFATEYTRLDFDSVDVSLCGKGKLDKDSILHSPKLDLQLKATKNKNINSDGTISFNLAIKNYNDLRAHCLVPKILVVLFLPSDENNWLEHSLDHLIIKECANWMSLRGLPDSKNDGHQTVRIPVANAFSPEIVRELLCKISKEEEL